MKINISSLNTSTHYASCNSWNPFTRYLHMLFWREWKNMRYFLIRQSKMEVDTKIPGEEFVLFLVVLQIVLLLLLAIRDHRFYGLTKLPEVKVLKFLIRVIMFDVIIRFVTQEQDSVSVCYFLVVFGIYSLRSFLLMFCQTLISQETVFASAEWLGTQVEEVVTWPLERIFINIPGVEVVRSSSAKELFLLLMLNLLGE